MVGRGSDGCTVFPDAAVLARPRGRRDRGHDHRVARRRGRRFQKGQVLAQIDSAKSVFDFEAPCDGLVMRLLHLEGETVSLSEPVLEIETADPAMRDWIPPAAAGAAAPACPKPAAAQPRPARPAGRSSWALAATCPPRVVDQRGAGAGILRNLRRVRLPGHRHPPAALGRATGEALGHGLSRRPWRRSANRTSPPRTSTPSSWPPPRPTWPCPRPPASSRTA